MTHLPCEILPKEHYFPVGDQRLLQSTAGTIVIPDQHQAPQNETNLNIVSLVDHSLSFNLSTAWLTFHKHVKWDNVSERTGPPVKPIYCYYYYHHSYFQTTLNLDCWAKLLRCQSHSHFPISYLPPSLSVHSMCKPNHFLSLGRTSMTHCYPRPLLAPFWLSFLNIS